MNAEDVRAALGVSPRRAYLKVSEFAEIIGYNPRHVYKLLRENRIPVLIIAPCTPNGKPGYRVPLEAALKFVAENTYVLDERDVK